MKGAVNIILITCDFIVKAEVHVSLKLEVISEQVASSFVFKKSFPRPSSTSTSCADAILQR